MTDMLYHDRAGRKVFVPTNTPTWVIDGRFGYVIDFDRASDEYLYCDIPVVVDEPLTLAAWFNFANTTNHQAIISLNTLTKGARQSEFYEILAQGAVGGDPIRALVVGENDQFRWADSTSGYSANTWHHACGVFASETSRAAYIDGGNKGTNSDDTGNVLVENTCIGAAYRQEGAEGPQIISPSDGLVSGACIWNRVLSDAEVEYAYRNPWDLYETVRPRYWAITLAEEASDSQAAYLKGEDTATDAQAAFLAGGINVSDNQPAFLWGGVNVTDSTPAFLEGGGTETSDDTAAFLWGQDTATSSTEAYLLGSIDVTTSAEAYLKGISTLQTDSSPAYLEGISTLQSDSQSAYLKGQSSTSGSLEAYLVGGINVTTDIEAYTQGSSDVTTSTSVYLDGMGERLTPDGDVGQSGSWKREDDSTSNLYQSIDEYPGANDTDYVWHEGAQIGDYFEVTLSDPTYGNIGAGDVKVFWRIRRRSGSDTITFKVELREGAAIRASDSRVLTDTDTTYIWTLSSGEKSSITDWTNLRLRFTVESLT
ncbi:MAG: LamG-like jellyroll fold domain-containing protein [Candidatus Thorarchaeota archaeon]